MLVLIDLMQAAVYKNQTPPYVGYEDTHLHSISGLRSTEQREKEKFKKWLQTIMSHASLAKRMKYRVKLVLLRRVRITAGAQNGWSLSEGRASGKK